MARYLIQASYSSESVQNMVRNPQDRAAVVGAMAERLGGTLESFYFAFGDYDVVAILDVPDHVTMAAIAMAVGGSGGLKTFKTTVLIPMDEAVEAMRKAGTLGYQPPRGR